MREQVVQQFDATIRLQLARAKPEIVNFILTHERKEMVIQRLLREITQAERKRGGMPLKRTTFDLLVGDVAKLFAKNVIQYAEEQAISSIKRQAMIDEQAAVDNFDAEQKELARDLHRAETTPTSALTGEAFDVLKPKRVQILDTSGAPIKAETTTA